MLFLTKIVIKYQSPNAVNGFRLPIPSFSV